MSTVEADEGQIVVDLIYGQGARPRSTAPEPALLPHLGAYLCHDYSIEDVLNVAAEFSEDGNTAPAWTPLWDATLWGIAGRDDVETALDNLESVVANQLRIVRTLRHSDRKEAARLTESRIDIGPTYSSIAGAARLSPLLSRKQLTGLFKDPDLDPYSLDPESVRSLLAAATMNSIDLSDDWVDATLNGAWMRIYAESRTAHILPNLSPRLRPGIADRLAGWLTEQRLPPDMRALWVSRIGPFVSSDEVWNHGGLLDDLEPLWRDHVSALLSVPWPEEPWNDVFRAHPEYEQFPAIKRPHETTVNAANDIRSRWTAHAAATLERSAPMDDSDFEGTVASEAAPPAEQSGPDGSDAEMTAESLDDAGPPAASSIPSPAQPDEPRRLQADVTLGASGKLVAAFVANESHVIKVSIGRDARVRADAGIEEELEEIFESTDLDEVLLPVWFHAPGHSQTGSIKVPRNFVRDSSAVKFLFTAPANGRVLARIHVMRPGGRMLLQSAVLAGDVVANEATAIAHPVGMQLNVDVVAGDLSDPSASPNGRTIITDHETSIVEDDGALIEIDVTKVQDSLRKMVHEIESAADKHGLDDKAVDKTLVNLAIGGQTLRTTFQKQLGDLAKASPLQIVSLLDTDVLPLELVYDGPPLAINSEICPTWRKALREGRCSNCSGGGPDNDHAPARVCPMRFWSMTKVIERRTADARGGPFRVFGERSAGRTSLRPFDAMIVSASGRVAASEVDDLRDFAKTQLKVPTDIAADWAMWLDAVDDKHPELLVAIPHNEEVSFGLSSALLLGEPTDDTTTPPASTLLAGSVTSAHVRSANDDPGPVVLLLGCDTQFEEGRLSAFAGEFRENGAAVTIGTIGELRADQAPHAARVLIDKIVRPPAGALSVGDTLLSARRQLLSDGLIMALLLVANGDAEWQLPK